jgi:hypothetical protein
MSAHILQGPMTKALRNADVVVLTQPAVVAIPDNDNDSRIWATATVLIRDVNSHLWLPL